MPIAAHVAPNHRVQQRGGYAAGGLQAVEAIRFDLLGQRTAGGPDREQAKLILHRSNLRRFEVQRPARKPAESWANCIDRFIP